MKVADSLSITGEIFFYMNNSADGAGRLVAHVTNLVVTVGQQWVAQRMAGSTSPAPLDMDYMAIGQDTVAPVLGDIELRQELGRVKMAATPQVTANRITYTATFAEGIGTGGITEAGIFDSSVNGTMLSRSVFPVVNKQVDDYLTVLWVISVGTPL